MKKCLLLLSSWVLLAACSGGENAADSGGSGSAEAAKPAPAASSQSYRVFSEQNYVPFIMHDGNNKVSGFEYDLLNAIAQKQGFKLTFTAHTWEDLFPTLARGEADIITSGLTITEERQKNMDFTDSHLETETTLLTKNEKIHQFADMMGKRIGIQNGTIQTQLAEQYQKGNGEIEKYDTPWLTVNAVLKNEVDATLGDLAVMNYYVKQYPDQKIRVVRDPKAQKEQLAFAVKKDNAELKNKLNQGLKQIKDDGTYQKIHDKWFGKVS